MNEVLNGELDVISEAEDTTISDDGINDANEEAYTQENENQPPEELEEDELKDGAEDAEAEGDIDELKSLFPELSSINSADDLKYAEKYRRFRQMGLSPAEAYLATGEQRTKEPRYRPASPISVTRRTDGIPDRHLRAAREIFSDLSDVEIQALYKRVTK